MNSDEKKIILLVEDEVITAMMEKMELERKGYIIHHVTTGEDAVKTIIENLLTINLILMDIDLGSGIDGTQAAEQILNKKEIPVLFLSSHTEPDVVEKTEKITSYGYVVKNSGITVLDASIKMAFKLYEAKIREREKDAILREKDIQFRKLSANVPELIYQFTRKPDGSYCVPIASEGIKNIFGCSPEDVINDFSPIANVLYSEDSERIIRDIEYSAEHLSYFTCEFRVQIPDKPIQWILSRSTPEKLPDGSITWYGFNADITERKQLEIERQKFYLLAESSSEFIGMCDLDMNPLYVNPAGRRMVGLPDMEAACRVKVQDYYFPEDQQFIAEEFFPRVLREGQGDVEIRLRHFQTGEPIWMFYYLFSVKDENNTPIGWATVSRDITEKKQIEKVLRRNEKDLMESQRFAHIGSWRLDVATNQVFWTKELYNMYGYDPSLPPPPYTEHMKLFTPESWERLSSALAHTRETGIPYTLELESIRKDGSNGWLWVHGEADIDSEGNIFEIWGAAQDITDRKLAEIELEKTNSIIENVKNKLNYALNTSHIGAWELDLIDHTAWRSLTHDNIFGYNTLLPKWTFEMFIEHVFPDDRNYVIEKFNSAVSLKREWDFQCRIIRSDGEKRWIWAKGNPQYDTNENPIIMFGIVQDITELKKKEDTIL